MILKALALCLIALFALLLLLPAPPDRGAGGKSAVARRIPALRDTLDPLAKVPLPDVLLQERNIVRQVQPARMPEPAPAPAPAPVAAPVIAEQDTQAVPLRKPAFEPPPASGAGLSTRGPPEPERKVVSLTPAPAGRVELPSKSTLRGWVKSQAWEFLGGVDAQGNILYRFEVWLEAPAGMLGAIKQVSYDYDAPSATPESRNSRSSDGGFRVRFGSLSCAKKLTVEVTMTDGSRRQAVVDGCKALN